MRHTTLKKVKYLQRDMDNDNKIIRYKFGTSKEEAGSDKDCGICPFKSVYISETSRRLLSMQCFLLDIQLKYLYPKNVV